MMKTPKMKKIGPYVVLLICLSLTVLVWLLLNNFNQKLAQERYQDRTDQIVSAITKRMEDYATVLGGGAAFLTASEGVTRDGWRTYIEHLSIKETFPGIQGIGFSKVIQPSELTQYTQQIRAEGFPDYTVWPEGERGVYTSIIFLEPFDARNQRAFGYDMFSEPMRRAAMERARDTDTASISGKVTLVQETEQDVQAGFLMYVPVYMHGIPTNSVEERRAALQGYVYSPFRIKNLIDGTFPEPMNEIDFEIFDGVEVSSSTLMYDSDESGRGLDEESEPMFFDYKTIDLYGHQWTLYFATRPSFELASAQFESWGVLVTGMIISLLAFLFVRGQENTRERALVLAHDMTSVLRKREEELRNSESMWRGLVNANPESVYLTDAAGIVLAANETSAQRFGRDVQEMIGANYFDFLLPEVAAERKARIDEVIASGKPVRFEDNCTGRFIDNYIHPIFDNDGKLIRLAFLGIDITERKQGEEILKKLSSVVEQAADLVFITDYNGVIEYINPAFERLTGYTKDEAIGQTPRILKSGKHTPDEYKQLWETIQAGNVSQRTMSNRKKNGGLFYEEKTVTPLWNEQRNITHFVSTGRDITERKRAEVALRESETRYRIVADNTYTWEFWLNPEEQFIYTSPSCERITGYTADKFIAEANLLTQIIHPDDLPSYDRHRREVTEPPAPGEVEFRVLRPDGTWRWIDHVCQPVFDDDGCFMGTRGSNRDITDRKQAEEELCSLNAELEQRVTERTAQLEAARDEAEKANRAKSEFLSRMSHELRTPLNSILGFSQLMKMDKLTPDQVVGVDQILKSGRHLLNLINEVLDISRIEAGRLELSPEIVNVEEAILQTADLIRPLADQRHITIHVKVPSSRDVFVIADRQRLKQVLLNLLSNAVKYNREQGEIRITTSLLADGYLHLQVQDTGPGIVPENLEPLFNPFERIGAEQTETEGAGLGLAIAKKLVEAMGGRIGVESTLGQGSTFWLDLQLTTQQEEALVIAKMDDFLKTTSNHVAGTILYVEDNLSNITLMEKIVARLPGVELISTMQGCMAMDLARQHKPRLILLDLNLPDVNGAEVLQWLRADSETKDIPVVVMSADAMPSQIEHLLAIGAQDYLTKPIDVKVFLKMVSEMLAG
ncbi:MAG: multi-sensor hybrid histidine kinase [Chloroflexi bacterium]|nr:MAG: multi-sensor hybrid histidine kinase [Chloroflexota bacterium]